MYNLHLQFDECVFKRLRSEMGLRIMCDGGYSFPDEFVKKIITTIDKGETDVRLVLK